MHLGVKAEAQRADGAGGRERCRLGLWVEALELPEENTDLGSWASKPQPTLDTARVAQGHKAPHGSVFCVPEKWGPQTPLLLLKGASGLKCSLRSKCTVFSDHFSYHSHCLGIFLGRGTEGCHSAVGDIADGMSERWKEGNFVTQRAYY